MTRVVRQRKPRQTINYNDIVNKVDFQLLRKQRRAIIEIMAHFTSPNQGICTSASYNEWSDHLSGVTNLLEEIDDRHYFENKKRREAKVTRL